MFKIGDSVYCCRGTGYRNLKVVNYKKHKNYIKFICDGEYLERERYSNEYFWKEGRFEFSPYELSLKPFPEKTYHEENKWDNIIQRIPNMCTSVLYMYEDYLDGKLNLTPFYQRGLVWTLEQKQKYLEAVFKDKAKITPTILLNWKNVDEDVYEVLDGLQRLTAIFDFINDKFPIFDEIYFSDMSIKDRYFILNKDIKYTRIEKLNHKNLTDNEKIELFLEINELGTKMSQEHIDKVKGMIK